MMVFCLYLVGEFFDPPLVLADPLLELLAFLLLRVQLVLQVSYLSTGQNNILTSTHYSLMGWNSEELWTPYLHYKL